ncbi:MAG: copper homeostasis protein [Alteromonadaceae bacterium]|jgi:copper homeostasis protein
MTAVEICLSSDNHQRLTNNVEKVFSAGAERIELCSAMAQDGLTPDTDAIIIARKAFGQRPGLMVMIRPRAGDFDYHSDEIKLMLKQIKLAAQADADGVVLGVLSTLNGEVIINLPVLKQLVIASKKLNLQVGFHRAFDAVDDRKLALTQLIQLNVDRVLTSGTAWGESSTAIAGLDNLVDIVSWADNKIETVVAGGITPSIGKKVLNRLAQLKGQVSLHAYSNVLNNDEICEDKLNALINFR